MSSSRSGIQLGKKGSSELLCPFLLPRSPCSHPANTHTHTHAHTHTTHSCYCIASLTSPFTHRAVTRSYYRGAAGALLVYDIASRESYNALTNWLTDARTLASPNIIIVMVGNKKDLEAEREVTFMEASRFAQENGMCMRCGFVG